MFNNLILNIDSYKASHYLQYPQGTQTVSSYIESRGGDYQQLLFFGLQAFIQTYLTRAITTQDIAQAAALLPEHGLPFNAEGWQYILREHQGFLPLQISAVAEGTLLPVQHVLVQVQNTDPACYWLTSYIETALLRAVWYPTTVATLSWHVKCIIRRFLQQTADDLSGLPFKLHDFGARGASSLEAASLGGAAHLVNFQGSDTIAGILAAQRYYDEPMAGYSIPAAEHATMTCWGKQHEVDAYSNMLQQFAGAGKALAVVSDSYDLWHAVEHLWGEQLKQQVVDNGGTVVIRPDSGNPLEVSCQVIEVLMEKFGYKLNSKGYRVLPDYLRVIQGDGISPSSIEAILIRMQSQGLSADNIAFGMGGALLQKVHRDTLRFAMKASAAQINGQWQDVYKDPATDRTKRSKAGRLALVRNPQGQYTTIRQDELAERDDLLQTVFHNGELLNQTTFAAIRERAQRSEKLLGF